MAGSAASMPATIGGLPSILPDVPVCAVLIGLFVTLAASHMTIYQMNRRRDHKFLFNALLFGFSMSRIAALALRIAWATRPTNTGVALAAQIFLNAGILLVYVINVHLAWRMVRSSKPRFGWNPIVRLCNSVFLWAVLAMFIPLLILLILRVTKPTLPHLDTAFSVIAKMAQTYFMAIAIFAALLLAVAITGAEEDKDHFGKGSWAVRGSVLALAIAFTVVEAGFRCGTTWTTAPPATHPAWWDSKPAFYCFNFVMDILVLTCYLVGRIDQRFHIPNGSGKRSTYASEAREEEKVQGGNTTEDRRASAEPDARMVNGGTSLVQ